jgi:hypothetical protein
VNGYLVRAFFRLERAVQEVKRTRDRNFDRLQAACATDFNPAIELADQADIVNCAVPTVVLTNQFGAAFGLKRANLPHIRTEFDFSGLELMLKLQVPDFQVLNANLHDATCSRSHFRPMDNADPLVSD